MTEESHPTFRTKNGICTITLEQIVLTRKRVRGRFTAALLGTGSIRRLLILYTVLGLSLLGIGVLYLARAKYGDAIVPIIMGAFLLVNAIRSRNNSAAPLIPRDQIQSITATKPIPPATRGYFKVQFLQGSKSVTRLIILPGVLDGGQAEFDKAMAVFRGSGLTVI
ncbi:MAG: hypothetical protein O2931_09560 [Planctomycetota bacterium]|nr:hypothetical protein [Planctomycetota bacterium]MDA1179028.1 hypothetical protein [Planctomycetota bacterium]